MLFSREMLLRIMPVRRHGRKKYISQQQGRVKRFLLYGFVSIIVSIGLVFLGGYFLADYYVQSTKFRDFLQLKIAKSLGGTVSLSPLQRSGKNWQVATISARSEKAGLQSLGIVNMQTAINYGKLWDNEVSLDVLTVNSLDLRLLYLPEKNDEISVDGENIVDGDLVDSRGVYDGEDEAGQELARRESTAWYAAYVPTMFSLGNAHINDLNIVCALPQGEVRVLASVADMAINTQDNMYKLSLTGGRYEQPGKYFSRGVIENIQLRYVNNRLVVPEAKVKMDEGGRLGIVGEWSFAGEGSDINATISGVPLKSLLSPTWVKSLEGTLRATARIIGSPQEKISATGNVSLEKAIITALPVLDTVAAFTATGRFRRVEMDIAKADFRYTDGETHVSNIILNSEGLLRIEGGISLVGEALSGTLMLGLPPGLLAHLPGAEESVFSAQTNEGKYGLLWAKVRLSGTLDSPRENLSQQLIAAAGERLFRTLPGSGKKILNFTRSLADTFVPAAAAASEDSDVSSDHKEGGEKTSDKSRKEIKVGEELLKAGFRLLGN